MIAKLPQCATALIKDLERQLDASQALLAEARAEIDHIKQVEFPKRIEKLRAEASQEAARECINIIYSIWAQNPMGRYINDNMADLVRSKFKLEG